MCVSYFFLSNNFISVVSFRCAHLLALVIYFISFRPSLSLSFTQIFPFRNGDHSGWPKTICGRHPKWSPDKIKGNTRAWFESTKLWIKQIAIVIALFHSKIVFIMSLSHSLNCIFSSLKPFENLVTNNKNIYYFSFFLRIEPPLIQFIH